MNFRYKIINYGYDVNYPSISFYRYWNISLPVGIYKNLWFGLHFFRALKIIKNYPIGITINIDHETEVF